MATPPTGRARHAAVPPSRWPFVSESQRRLVADRLEAARAAVTPFVSTLRSGHIGKVVVATGLLSCLGFAAMAQTPPDVARLHAQAAAAISADRSPVERSAVRDAAGVPANRSGRPGVALGTPEQIQAEAAAAARAAAAKAAAKAAAAAKARAKAKPVAGLTQKQMDNAQRIVNEGKALKLPKRAYVLAVACAMQESNLLNLASAVLPESYAYAHDGQGSDHDSIGLFQQRPSSGWGSVKNIMKPEYAAMRFYQGLMSVPGWQSMALTYAVQAVQVSAFPDAYAQHESRANTVVNALTS